MTPPFITYLRGDGKDSSYLVRVRRDEAKLVVGERQLGVGAGNLYQLKNALCPVIVSKGDAEVFIDMPQSGAHRIRRW